MARRGLAYLNIITEGETSKRSGETFLHLEIVGFTFGFFGNDRAAPVDTALLILCTTYTHTSRIYG